MLLALYRELVFVILQFFREENWKQTEHILEFESGVFFNVDYVEELVTRGKWEELEKYLAGFIRVDDNRYSVKMLFELRKQRYLEALDRKDTVKALEILNRDLKAFETLNEDLFKDLALLLTMENFRNHEHLTNYTDSRSARAMLLVEIKKLIHLNPELKDKCEFPDVSHSRLRQLVNQSINWQHTLCKNPRSIPDVRTLFVDHVCDEASTSQPANQLIRPMLRAFQASSGQGVIDPSSLTHRTTGGASVLATINTADSEHGLKRPRTFGATEELNHFLARSSHAHVRNLTPSDALPTSVIKVISQCATVTSMDFHPDNQTVLAVGTNTGVVTIWEVTNKSRIALKRFTIWNTGALSKALQTAFASKPPCMVNRVMWSPDGRLLGVAYSLHIVHVYSYHAGSGIRHHLEIEAHVGNVSDLAFTNLHHQSLLITCGEDRTIKVWDAVTGANQYTFAGHDAPISSICLHTKDNIPYILSSSADGKIKTWLYDGQRSRVDFDAPIHTYTRLAYSTDGSRLFSCGSQNEGASYLVEWNENEGTVKQTYHGLRKPSLGIVQFDTTKRLLAVGDEFSVKFWDMDCTQLLANTKAEGGLPASPCIRFNKDGILLAVSTSAKEVKILGNVDGVRLVRTPENQVDVSQAASVAVSKASTSTSGVASTSAARGRLGRLPFGVLATMNPESQNPPNAGSRRTGRPELSNDERAKEITEPSHLRSARLPDNLLAVRIVRLKYLYSGDGVLALGNNAVHKLWKWRKTEQNPSGNATTVVAPHLWQPASGMLMINDVREGNQGDVIPCFDLSKNSSYAISASGGNVSLFNLAAFKTMTTFGKPPPVVTCLAFYPADNNTIAMGMSDYSIHIFNARHEEVLVKLTGHQKAVTGLVFSMEKMILVSSGADAQLCVWKTGNWEIHTSKFLQIPSRRGSNPSGDTRIQLNMDHTCLLVIHQTHIGIHDPLNLDRLMQWIPKEESGWIADAVYSCNGQSIFVITEDGNVSVLTANNLRLRCRINGAAYIPSNVRVSPCAIAAHPFNPNQVALGLSDGGVCVVEPLESDREWGRDPSAEAAPETSTKP